MGTAVAAAVRDASRVMSERVVGVVREPNPPYGPDVESDAERGAIPSGPATWADIDAVEELAEEIAILAADLHSAKERFLALVSPFDRIEGWKLLGHRTCAHWLSERTGLDLGTAREHVRVARALSGLPVTRAAMSRGELSFSQVRALTRVAKPDTEEDLVDLARDCTTSVLERMVRAWKKGTRKEEAAWERIRHESRRLAVFPNEDGMYVVLGLLEPEVAVLLLRGLEAAADALYRERGPLPVGPSRPGRVTAAERAAAQRRADVLGLLVERALAAGFGAPNAESTVGSGCGTCCGMSAETDGSVEGRGPDGDDDQPAERGEEGDSSEDRGAPISGTRAERYQVVLHVEAETLEAEGEPGRSELEDGTRISAETSRRLSCDSGVIRVTRSREGEVLDVPGGSLAGSSLPGRRSYGCRCVNTGWTHARSPRESRTTART